MENATNIQRNRVFVPLLLVAMAVRALDFTQRSLWFDEAVEYLTASATISELLSRVATLNYQPPLFASLLHFWLRISLHPVWLRYLPLCLSMLTLAVVIRWSYERNGPRAALLAGLVMAFMPTEVYYAQDVGEYALLFFLLTSALYFLDRSWMTPYWTNWLGWGILSAGAMYTHYGAIIILVPAAAVTLLGSIWKRQRAVWQKQLLVSAGLILSTLPLLIYFLPSQINRGGSGGGWRTYTFPGLGTTVSQFIELLHHTFLYNFSGGPLSEVSTAPTTILLILLALVLALTIRQLPVHWLLWTGLALSLYFILVKLGYYVGGFRYGLIFTPLLVVLIAQALNTLWEKRVALATLSLFLLLGVEIYGLPNPTLSGWIREQSTWQPREQMAQTFAYWRTQRETDDRTFVYYGAVPAFHYYLQATGVDKEQSKQPVMCDAQESYAVCREYRLFYSPWSRQLSAEENVAQLYEMLGQRPDRLWLIFSHVHQEEHREILVRLAPAYEIVQSSNQSAEAAFLLVRR